MTGSEFHTVVLDNEAVHALLNTRHRKHERTVAYLEILLARRRNRRRSDPRARLVVPTAVRVEAGWCRTDPAAAVLNRLRVQDAPLDQASADQAAAVSTELGVSVADAHLAAVLAEAVRPVAVVTSDVEEVRRIGAHLDVAVTVVAL